MANHPYRDLYSEINFLASTMMSDGKFNTCFDKQTWMRTEELTQNILDQRSDYCALKQGTTYYGQIKLAVLQNINPKDKKEVYKSYPLIFADNDLTALLPSLNEITTDGAIANGTEYLGQTFPGYAQRPNKAFTKDQYLELRHTERLKDSIYDAAVTNSLSTKAGIDYFWGGKSIATIKTEMMKDIETKCTHCTAKRRKAVVNKALNTIANLEKSNPQLYKRFNDPKDIVVSMCNQLIDAGYYDGLDGLRKPRLTEVPPNELKEVVVIATKSGKKPKLQFDSNAFENFNYKFKPSLDGLKVGPDAARETFLYKMGIYQKVVHQGHSNLLFMTNALSKKDDSSGLVTYSPKVQCDQNSIWSDADKVREAMAEAKGEADKVLEDLNKAITPANLSSLKSADNNRDQIKKILDVNPTAVGQALAENPDLTYLVCEGLYNKLAQDFNKQQLQNAALWGVRIVGGAFVATGIGAPGGLALLSATAAGTAGAADLALQNEQSQEAKELAQINEMQYRGGQSSNQYLLNMSEEKIREYKQLKLDVMSVVGVGFDFIPVIGEGVSLFGNMSRFSRVVNSAKGSKYFENLLLTKKNPVAALDEFAKTDAAYLKLEREVLITEREVKQGSKTYTTQDEALANSRKPVAYGPKGEIIPPDHYGDGYHGTNLTWDYIVKNGEIPAKKTANPSLNLYDHILGKPSSQFRGTTEVISVPGGGGASEWADVGGIVVQVDDVPLWNARKFAEDKALSTAGWGGEAENVMPSRIPIFCITKYGKVVMSGSGNKIVRTWVNNPYHDVVKCKSFWKP